MKNKNSQLKKLGLAALALVLFVGSIYALSSKNSEEMQVELQFSSADLTYLELDTFLRRFTDWNPICGDGEDSFVEECDDGNLEDGDGCSSLCKIELLDPICGNAIVEEGEHCDDGNLKNTDTCSDQCKVIRRTGGGGGSGVSGGGGSSASSICGDGVVGLGEQCDDGNQVTEACAYGAESCTVCDSSCQTVSGAVGYCSDAIVQATEGEVCDDGNLVDSDGCSSSCQLEEDDEQEEVQEEGQEEEAVCGNAVVEGLEQCDDGNTITETCDYGLESCMVCDSSCQNVAGGGITYCSDGVVQGSEGETCDDGNLVNSDGCSDQCLVEEFVFDTLPMSLDDYLTDLKTKIIPEASEEFHLSTSQEVADFKSGFEAFINEDYFVADSFFDPLDYTMIKLEDPIGKDYLVITEDTFDGSGDFEKGGITLIYEPLATRVNMQISVPHPIADFRTMETAIKIFETAELGFMAVSNSHRRASSTLSADQGQYGYHESDPAHVDVNEYTAIVEVLNDLYTDSNQAYTYFEIHGFTPSNYPELDPFDPLGAIISSGSEETTTPLQNAISDQFDVQFPTYPSVECGAEVETLCATLNTAINVVDDSNANSTAIHIEAIKDGVRAEESNQQKLANAVLAALEQLGL